MTFAKRLIQFQFKIGETGETIIVEDLRCSVDIQRLGLGSARCDARIYGMSMSLMNTLTTNYQFYVEGYHNNVLTILAGDERSGMAVVFTGTIYWAWCDARQQPDVVFWVSAAPGQHAALKAVPPVSFNGYVDAAIVARGIAEQMQYSLSNNGVSAQIANPYYPGTPKAQIESLCQAVDCLYEIDETHKTIWIWPKGSAKSETTAEVSAYTGLIGYPAFTQSGIHFSSLYNPQIEFGMKIKMESGLTPANGEWLVLKMSHSLEADMPDGRWFTEVEAVYPKAAKME